MTARILLAMLLLAAPLPSVAQEPPPAEAPAVPAEETTDEPASAAEDDGDSSEGATPDAAPSPADDADSRTSPSDSSVPAEAGDEATRVEVTEVPPVPQRVPESRNSEDSSELEPQANPLAEFPQEKKSTPAPRATVPPASRNVESVYGKAGKSFVLSVDGFLRFQMQCIYPGSFCGVPTPSDENARRNPFVGRNDGFGLGSARVNLRGSYGTRLYVRLSLEGAQTVYDNDQSPVGNLDTGLRDAYLRFELADWLGLYVGRFKPPYDSENLTAVENIFFSRRSLESRGVRRHEGFVADGFNGFSPGRQMGMMLAGSHTLGGADKVLGYQLALTNGNSGLSSLNDNDSFAAFGRVTFNLKGDVDPEFEKYRRADEEGPATYRPSEGLLLGLGGFTNRVTTGLPPNRFDDTVSGAGFDVAAKYGFLIAQGQILATQTRHHTLGDTSDERGLGGHAQLSFELADYGLYPGYRFAYLNPREAVDDSTILVTADGDQVIHHTFGVKWVSSLFPLIGFLEYTVALEEAGRQIPNDRVEAAIQVIFE